MSRFPPATSIYAPVTMTRTAYAQLMGQKFHPPKIFGHWMESEGSTEWRWKDVGMKVVGDRESWHVLENRRLKRNLLTCLGLRIRDAIRGKQVPGLVCIFVRAGVCKSVEPFGFVVNSTVPDTDQ